MLSLVNSRQVLGESTNSMHVELLLRRGSVRYRFQGRFFAKAAAVDILMQEAMRERSFRHVEPMLRRRLSTVSVADALRRVARLSL